MRKINLIAIYCILCVSAGAQAQNNAPGNALGTPKSEAQVPVVDPFARNVVRPAQYGAVPVVKTKNDKKSDTQAIDFNYRYDDDFARLPDLRNYRVISITAKPVPKSPLMFGPDLSVPGLGTSARKVYLRVTQSPKLLVAKQFIWDMFEQHKNFIDANFVIRKVKEGKETSFLVDLGPFVNERHAILFCTHILSELNKECIVDRNFQTKPEHTPFRNVAALGLSNSMIQQILLTNKQQDAANLYSSGFDIEEGDTLGKNNFVVLKINAKGIYLGSETGKLFLLPSDIIPSPYSGDDVPADK
jgi:hypothetical protein